MAKCNCGCGKETTGRAEYTKECSKRRRLELLHKWRDEDRDQMKRDLAEVKAIKEASKPKPRAEPKRILTDAEQRKHDIELEQRLAIKCGYGNGVCKSLPAEEVARLARQYRPPEKVESVGYFDRFFSGEAGTVFN